jgi:hypothetical protein
VGWPKKRMRRREKGKATLGWADLGRNGEKGGKGGERAWEGSWASRPIRREERRIKIFLFLFLNHFQTKF